MLLWFSFYENPRFLKELKDNPYVDVTSANLASSIGVWFTFAGICLGLYQFDTSNIEASVPHLLDSMKTAFATSILGMLLSFYFKFKQDKKQREFEDNQRKLEKEKTKQNEVVPDDAKISHLIEYLHKRDEQVQAQQQEFIEKITNSIIGDGDYTVIGQLKTLRFEMSDSQNKLRDEIKSANDLLINEFRSFAKDMLENNTKAFIEALNDTIRDFNSKIQEQFGENFKQLNEAVGKLLTWQEHYKDTIEKTNQNQVLIYKTLDNAANSLSAIEKSASTLINAADGLKNLIVTSAVYSKRLNDEIKILQDVANDAKEIAPSIQALCEKAIFAINGYLEETVNDTSNNVTDICNNMANNVSNNINSAISQIKSYSDTTHKEILMLTEELQTNISEVDDHLEKSQQAICKLVKESVHSIESISTSVVTTSRQQQQTIDKSVIITQEAIKQAADKLSTSSLEITKRTSASLEKMMEINNENLKQSSKNVSDNLNKTLNKSLEDFGTFLIKISQGFANDYTPLVNRLREVLMIVENTKIGGKK